MLCLRCGATCPESATNCPTCGAPLTSGGAPVRSSGLALAGLVLALAGVFSLYLALLGFAVSTVAWLQCRRGEMKGGGLAVAGMAIGALLVVVGVVRRW